MCIAIKHNCTSSDTIHVVPAYILTRDTPSSSYMMALREERLSWLLVLRREFRGLSLREDGTEMEGRRRLWNLGRAARRSHDRVCGPEGGHMTEYVRGGRVGRWSHDRCMHEHEES